MFALFIFEAAKINGFYTFKLRKKSNYNFLFFVGFFFLSFSQFFNLFYF